MDATTLDDEQATDLDEDEEPLDDEHEVEDGQPEAADADEHLNDAENDEDDDGAPRTRSTLPTGGAWEIVMADRGDDGQWRTVGEAVDGLRFMTIAVAHEHAEARNKREFGFRFDWLKEPSRAWVAVRVGHRGRIGVNAVAKPVEATLGTKTMAAG